MMDQDPNDNVEEPKKEEYDEDIICDICEVQIQSASSLITHKKLKHDPKICSDCGAVVKGEKALKDHRRKHVTVSCQRCSKEISKRNLNKHLQSCTGQNKPDPKTYMCDKCDYKTTVLCNLERHFERKHVEKRYSCERCEFVTKSKKKLEFHKKHAHVATECFTTHQCGWCKYESRRAENTRRHEKTCEVRKRSQPLDIKPIEKDELGELYAQVGSTVTVRDFNTIIRWFKSKFGSQWFSKGSYDLIKYFTYK